MKTLIVALVILTSSHSFAAETPCRVSMEGLPPQAVSLLMKKGYIMDQSSKTSIKASNQETHVLHEEGAYSQEYQLTLTINQGGTTYQSVTLTYEDDTETPVEFGWAAHRLARRLHSGAYLQEKFGICRY